MTDYLVQFGRSAFVGRFSYPHDGPIPRGQSVVVKSVRGLETGLVLCPALERFATCIGERAGELIRHESETDNLALQKSNQIASTILNAAESRSKELPISFVEAEASLDGATVVLHIIPFAECDLSTLLSNLSAEFQTTVTLQDLSRPTALPDAPDAVEAGCGKPNCGSESGGGGCGTSGGCSTGSCSKGKIKSAEELTEYFADLRNKMEATVASRVALH